MSENSLPTNSAQSDTRTLLWRLFSEHGRQHISKYVMAAVLLGLGALATSTTAYLLKPVLNRMVSSDGFKELRLLSFAVFGLFAFRGLVTYGSMVLLSRTGNRIIADVQMRVFKHLMQQSMRFFHDRHSSEFMTRVALSANGVRDALQILVTSLARDILTAVGLVGVMIIQDPMMALIALSVVPVAAYSLSRLIKRVRKQARRSFDGSTRIMQTIQEAVQGSRIVKSFNLEGLMLRRMQESVTDVERAANRMSAGMAISSPMSDALAGLAIGAVIFYGSWRITVTQADPGSFFSFVAALLLAYEPAKRLARLNLEIQNGLVGARLIYEVLDSPAAEIPDASQPELSVTQGKIAFDRVSFGYRDDEAVLSAMSFVAEPGKTTALVGPSGGGKSTIISMIQRFYEPSAGSIVIDGQVIAGVDLASLREKIAFVSQDVFLFRGTIRENIALGREGATQDEIIAAAKKANAHDFIMAFSDGYESNVGEQGAQMSGGQRQRIAIARAILKDAPILLLDEPTAALDSESEREVQKALNELCVGRTTLVVAHRLQTIVNADCICVIENGHVVEQGTHGELIAGDGTYRSFCRMQFGDVVMGSPLAV